MRGSEIIKEKQEFEDLYKKNEKKRSAMQSNYINLSIVEDTSKNRNSEIQSRIDELKKQIKKRIIVNWKPEILLCKKFDIPNPYENKPFIEPDQESEKVHKFKIKDFVKGDTIKGNKSEENKQKIQNDGNAFFKEVQESFIQDLKNDGEIPKIDENKEKIVENCEKQEEKLEQQLVVSMEKRPEMSLFQSIFDD